MNTKKNAKTPFDLLFIATQTALLIMCCATILSIDWNVSIMQELTNTIIKVIILFVISIITQRLYYFAKKKTDIQ